MFLRVHKIFEEALLMREQLTRLMAYCLKLGADYADIRVKEVETESIVLENGKVKSIDTDRSIGFGIRILYSGSVGFAATSEPDRLEETAKTAFTLAQASMELQKEKTVLTPKPMVVDRFETPIEIDSFTVPMTDKIALLMECERIMGAVPGVTRTHSDLSFRREDVTYCDSSGSYITQKFYQSGGGISATAAGEGGAQVRTYPDSFQGTHGRAGYEFVLALGLKEHAEEVARESVELLHAPECPSGIFDLVIDTTQMTLQIHESVGHPTELDRVLGSEIALAGSSFVRPENIHETLVYGSPHITIVADATHPGGLGTFGYDDEGVKACRTVLIDKGIFKNFTTSRDTAGKIDQVSNGAGLSDGWRNLPIVRMTNINLLPGEFELDELIAGVEDGFFLSVNKSWSIDDKRINFQFACEAAYEIKNGKKTGKIFKNPIYSAITPVFWGSCDGVANEKHWRMRGTPFCGKGQPPQMARVGHGSAPARFRKVKVGVGNAE